MPPTALRSANPWFREPWPWFLMALPGAVVVAGIITTVIAVRTNDGLVADDYYKKGLAINQTLARDDMAAQLGLRATLNVSGSEVRVMLQAREGVNLPERLEIVLSHPTRQGDDQRSVLVRQGDSYRGALVLQGSGLRNVILEDEGRSWRLTASLQLPATGAEILSRKP